MFVEYKIVEITNIKIRLSFIQNIRCILYSEVKLFSLFYNLNKYYILVYKNMYTKNNTTKYLLVYFRLLTKSKLNWRTDINQRN